MDQVLVFLYICNGWVFSFLKCSLNSNNFRGTQIPSITSCPVFFKGSAPNKDPRLDQGPWRPPPNEREENRNELSPRFDMGDNNQRHPHDLSSRGFRRGPSRGRGHDSPPHHGPDMQGSNPGGHHPFIHNLSSRGFKSNNPGRNENRDPRWGGSPDEPPQGRRPDEQHG